jgi:prepilin peptidase CpaA
MWMALSVALTSFGILGAISDVRSRRIPNRLILAGLAAALVLRAAWGLTPLWQGVAGALVAFAVGFPLFALRAFGGGDVKFLVLCGAFVGLPLIGRAALFAAAAGGLLAVWVIVQRRTPLVAWLRTRNLLQSLLTFGRQGERLTLQDPGAMAAPFGVAIAAGALIAWFGSAGGWIP